jgi:FlaA1/EpsC-like NDP-sugar epimerase
LFLPVAAMSIPASAFLVLLFDLSATFVAWFVTYGLRFNFEIPDENSRAMWNALPVMFVVHAVWFVGLRTYRPLWRFTSIPDVKRLAVAVFAAGVTTPVALVMLGRLHLVPRSLMILAPIVLFLMLVGARFVLRAWFDGHFVMERSLGRPVVILGAGNTAARLIADLHWSPTWQVVALLDDNEALHGSSLGGVNIYGGIDLLPEIVARLRPLSAFIAMPSASGEQRARVTQLAASLGLDVLSVADGGNPPIQGSLRLERVDPIDLLTARSTSVDDQALSDMVLGKVVLITGIDSPLGQAFCRQVVALGPKTLLCLDRSAKVLGELQRQLGTDSVNLILGDCRDELTLKTVFEQYRPDVVCHLSSARIPPGVVAGNEWESLRESVLPVLRSVRHAVAHESGMFILITAEGDPAEYPLANAGLRLAESICLAARTPITQCVCIRLGPEVVLAHDDLISEMKREIDAGGPASVSDPQSELSFLCESDAARLAVQAAALSMQSKDRTEGPVYLLRGSAPVRVADFARKLIKLSGFSEDQIAVVFTGARRRAAAEVSSTRPTAHPELLLSAVNPSRVSNGELEEIAAWLDVPERNVEQIDRDLSVWGIVTR